MKVSLNLISYYNQLAGGAPDPYEYGVDEIVRRIGNQLGAIEEVTYTGTKYDGIVVAKIVSCQKHPDADKLNVCMIDDGGVVQNVERGTSGFVQVVCGAPNVAADQLVAWIPPGRTVPSTVDKDPLVLEAREIRGKVSNGMIASMKELALGDTHEGILVVDPYDIGEELAKPGTEFKKLYGTDDVIIDCENKMFTHRPDCFGVMGVGREIAGIFGDTFKSPDWYYDRLTFESEANLPLASQNDIEDLVPRFTIQGVTDVTIAESPMWMQAFFNRMGQKPINNIVDLTNYYMTLTGQPLHAFDYDKVAQYCDGDVKIFPRMAEAGEKIDLLNGKTIELTDQDIVIATDKVPIALGGVMGGANTEVDENTKNIIIECANFDMYAIRRTSMRHGLFTDAVTRFNKGQSPLQNIRVLAKMVEDVRKFAGGKVAGDVIDISSFNAESDNLTRIETNVAFINDRLGSELSAEDIKKLLENVEFIVAVDDGSKLLITAPFWRMDIDIAEDIVEEVGRLYGYDKLPVELPARTSKPAAANSTRAFKQHVRDMLVRAGANEVLTYSFVHGDLMRNTGVDPEKWAFHLRNALSPDLQYYRTCLVPSLLAKVHSNLKAQAGDDANEFTLFEIGKVHIKNHMEDDDENMPKQMRRLSCVVAADDKTADAHHSGSAYYQAKKYLDHLTHGQAKYEPLENLDYPITSAYLKGRSARVSVNEQVLGVIGEFHSKAHKSFKLPDFCAGFELDLDLLAENLQAPKYQKLSTYPGTTQDITLEVDSNNLWDHVHDFVHAEIAVGAAEDDFEYSLEPQDIFKPEGADKKRISFRVHLAHHKRTLKRDEVNALLDHVEKQAEKTLNAKRI